MSAVNGPVRARATRSAPPRRRLNLVPRPYGKTPRAPFVAVVIMLMGAGLVGLLIVNTTMQKGAFELSSLQKRADDLSTQEAALQVQVDQLSSPENIAAKAGHLKMVPNTNPVFLRLTDGKVIGRPVPAVAGTNLPDIHPPGPTPAEIAAQKVKAAAKAKADAKAAKDAAAAKRAAADKTATSKKGGKKNDKPGSDKPGEEKKKGTGR